MANIVSEMAAVLWKVLKDDHMKTPTASDFKHISSDFEQLWNFPHCIGALDGKHIRINAPEHSGSQFFNYLDCPSSTCRCKLQIHCYRCRRIWKTE